MDLRHVSPTKGYSLRWFIIIYNDIPPFPSISLHIHFWKRPSRRTFLSAELDKGEVVGETIRCYIFHHVNSKIVTASEPNLFATAFLKTE